MGNIFSGLDKLGFDVKDVDLYEQEKKSREKKEVILSLKKHQS